MACAQQCTSVQKTNYMLINKSTYAQHSIKQPTHPPTYAHTYTHVNCLCVINECVHAWIVHKCVYMCACLRLYAHICVCVCTYVCVRMCVCFACHCGVNLYINSVFCPHVCTWVYTQLCMQYVKKMCHSCIVQFYIMLIADSFIVVDWKQDMPVLGWIVWYTCRLCRWTLFLTFCYNINIIWFSQSTGFSRDYGIWDCIRTRRLNSSPCTMYFTGANTHIVFYNSRMYIWMNPCNSVCHCMCCCIE